MCTPIKQCLETFWLGPQPAERNNAIATLASRLRSHTMLLKASRAAPASTRDELELYVLLLLVPAQGSKFPAPALKKYHRIQKFTTSRPMPFLQTGGPAVQHAKPGSRWFDDSSGIADQDDVHPVRSVRAQGHGLFDVGRA